MNKSRLIVALVMFYMLVGLAHAQEESPPEYVAFVSYEDIVNSEGTAVYWLDIQTGHIIVPSGLEDAVYCPFSWSPDRQWWLYAEQDEFEWNEYLLNIETGESVLLSGAHPHDIYFAWSPDSSRLVLAERYTTSPVLPQRTDTILLVPESGEVQRLTSVESDTQLILWLSETQFIQITIENYNDIHLYSIDLALDQIEEEVYTPVLNNFLFRGLSPDRTLMLLEAGSRPSKYYFLNVLTHELSLVWEDEDHHGIPGWSPDGRWFAYPNFNFERRYEERALFVFEDTSGGNTLSVAPSTYGGIPQDIYWSPDSNHAVLKTFYEGGTDPERLNLDIVDLETGQVQRIVSRMNTFAGAVVWVTNTRFLFTNAVNNNYPPAANDIYSYDLDTQELRNLTNSDTHELFACSYG